MGGVLMNILSIYGGIGSMIIGAKEQGYNIIAGFDNRKNFHTGTFEHNFGSRLYQDINAMFNYENIESKNIDMIIGHTSCGSYSKMGSIFGKEKYNERKKDRGDIPHFIEITKFINPKFFILDNLPGAVSAIPTEEWINNFPEYDIYFEWVSNYNYGNIQKGRNRLFVIGAKKELGYYFIPGEFENNKTIKDVIGDLPDYDVSEINHVHLEDDMIISMKNRHIKWDLQEETHNITLLEWKNWIKNTPYNKRFPYIYDNEKRVLKYIPGTCIVNMDSHSKVILGDLQAKLGMYRGDTLNPLTIRERARIQGCPDYFIFKPLDIKDNWSKHKLLRFQTGKYIPYQFTSFLTKQIKDFMDKGELYKEDYTCKRKIKSNDEINRAKYMYCQKTKYSNQKEACKYCWIRC
jgi:site-specific DNA-cytosine methylase